MAQPRAYTQTTNFNDFSTTNPADPHSGANLDTEFTELRQNTDDLNTNIALIQRDDGKIKNEAVHKDAFDQDALALIGLSGYEVRGAWLTATAYAIGDIVTNNDATYVTSTAHTSDTFSTDTANWTLLANAAINVTGHSVDIFNGTGSQTDFTLSYSYSSDTDFQVFVAGLLTSTTLYSVSGTTLTFTAAPASGTGNVIVWGGGNAVEATKSQVTSYRDDTLDHRDTAQDYATRVGATVRHFDGATNNVSDSSPSAQSGVYSAKEHAEGTTVPEGSAKQWADKVDGAVNTTFSAKAYAQGGTGVDTVSGSAKDWATKATTPSSTATDASAKEWATGTSTHKNDGSAKSWATITGAVVTGSEYSAKEYALGTTVAAGSAKDWAVLPEDSVVDGGSGYSALHHAAKSSASATASASSATASATSATNAATSYDNFDDRFLGPHTTVVREVGANVGKDNDGDALVAGAMYFDTTLTIMKVWSGSAWQRMTPTTGEQTNIDAAVADAVDIGKVAALDAEIGRLGAAAYSDGASAYLALLGTTAMANSTDGDIKVVADNITDVNTFATRYRVGASDPTTSKDDGDLFWNTNSDELKIYNTTAAAWQVPYLDSASVNAEATNAAISMAIALG